jgi:hypothetical protein
MLSLVVVNCLGLRLIVLERILRSSVSVQLTPGIAQGFGWLRSARPPVIGTRDGSVWRLKWTGIRSYPSNSAARELGKVSPERG